MKTIKHRVFGIMSDDGEIYDQRFSTKEEATANLTDDYWVTVAEITWEDKVPVKHEGWTNIYKGPNSIKRRVGIYKTKEEAMKFKTVYDDYVTTIKIQWEE